MLPVTAREPVHEAGIRGWVTLKGYIKAQAIVAFVDSIFIALGAFFLGAGSMTVPLALLIFLGSFIPIVGALVTGTVAVLIILLDQGIWSAVIMLVVILAVQQIEGNVLQPMLMSNAVSLHPLAVVLSVTAGTFLAGIIGALLAVPVVAFLNIVTLYLSGHDSMPGLSDRRDRIGGPPHTIHAQIAASYLRADRAATERRLRNWRVGLVGLVKVPRSRTGLQFPARAPVRGRLRVRRRTRRNNQSHSIGPVSRDSRGAGPIAIRRDFGVICPRFRVEGLGYLGSVSDIPG